ncbi:MAG: aminoacyl--tRNA ligase-related protein, partial [Patescibacteria group bacterium]
MRQSKLFTKTFKEAPKDEVSINAQLLIRGGFVDKVMAGVYTYLPLGLRVLNKIKNIIREEIDAVGGQEILMPALSPKENWEKTGRWAGLDVLFKLEGAGGKEYALGASHEEIVTPLVQKYAASYKDFPVCVYQIQDKFRNEPRAKSGLLRGREFSMKDMYSFHSNEEDLDRYYNQ